MNMVETQLWEILVPQKDALGASWRAGMHDEWDSMVTTMTGGLSICKPSIGKWADQKGGVSREHMIPVRIACSEEQIQRIMKITLKHYVQEAIFVSLISKKVFILNKY